MSRLFATIAALVGLGVAGALDASPLDGVRVAAIRDGVVCVGIGGNGLQCLDATAPKARLPVWSRDGTKIAYVGDAGALPALAFLVVVDMHGQNLAKIAIKPVGRGEVSSGMRTVEALEWIGSERIVVSGTVNPSCTESLVFDLQRGSVIGEYLDNARGASFSPDGKHVVTIDGAPHFSAPNSRAPVLRLDGREVLRDLHADLVDVGAIRWSGDGANFALTARDSSGHLRLALGQTKSNHVRWVDLPFVVPKGGKSPSLFWSDRGLHIQRVVAAKAAKSSSVSRPIPFEVRNMTVEESVLSFGQYDGSWKRSSRPEEDPLRAALAVRSAAVMKLASPGLRDIDVWCSGCAIGKVARSSKTLDSD